MISICLRLPPSPYRPLLRVLLCYECTSTKCIGWHKRFSYSQTPVSIFTRLCDWIQANHSLFLSQMKASRMSCGIMPGLNKLNKPIRALTICLSLYLSLLYSLACQNFVLDRNPCTAMFVGMSSHHWSHIISPRQPLWAFCLRIKFHQTCNNICNYMTLYWRSIAKRSVCTVEIARMVVKYDLSAPTLRFWFEMG